MARPYKNEMQELEATANFVFDLDLSGLISDVRRGWSVPALCVGSGGSLSAALAATRLHRHFTHQLAITSTPYELAYESVSHNCRTWLFSAGGRNVDIRNAAKWLQSRDHRHVNVLTTRSNSPLVKEISEHASTSTHIIRPPGGKDGFLATNSLLAFTLSMARSYTAIKDRNINELKDNILLKLSSSEWISGFKSQTETHWDRPVTIVLHGVATSAGAVDLESKFTEAALGSCQLADFRNFAHGRHHWLAKHAEKTNVIALVGSDDAKAADATLSMLPDSIPVARFDFQGSFASQCVESLLAAFFITDAAGEANEIDPGRPGVPDFGRKLYSLKKASPKPGKIDEDSRLIRQKVGRSVEPSLSRAQALQWREHLLAFKRKIQETTFAGLVLDFDGTIVETRARFDPPKATISEKLTWVAQHSVLGIATGRGQSARKDLQAVIPEKLWPRIIVGYYNGSVISTLDDESLPKQSNKAGNNLIGAAVAFRKDPWLQDNAICEERETQISFQARTGINTNRIWRRVCAIGQSLPGGAFKAYQSGHSVDVVAQSTSKLALFDAISHSLGAPILAIGDRGAWPGNDSELLQSPFAITVDACSPAPDTCWPLAPSGLRGPDALEWILNHLKVEGNRIKLNLGQPS